MNNIYQDQNSEINILRLRAQGRTYDKAKNYNLINVSASIIITFILSIIGNVFKECNLLLEFSIFYTFTSTILCFILEIKRAKMKSFAAHVQQLFDSELFDMPWEKIWGNKPSLDEIQIAAEKEKGDRYINWYDFAIQKVVKKAAILICFSINISYDKRLRSKFMNYLHLLFWFFIIVIILVGYLFGFTFKSYFLYGVAPSLPVILCYIKTYLDENTDKSNLDSLKENVNSMKTRLIQNERVDEKEFIDVQTMILKHRENCFDIPSCIYSRLRSENEESIHDFANRLADEFLINPEMNNE